MQENTFKFKFINNWRNIDKKIFFGFLILFFLGLFFSFSSTSSLAGERLNKDYYFFFFKTFNFYISFTYYYDFNFFFRNFIFKKNCYTFIYSFIYILSFSSFYWYRNKRSKKVARLLFFQVTTNRNTKTFFYFSYSKGFNF